MTDFKEVIEEIKKADVLTVFRHEHPDCDALGSQFGFVNFIQENFPEKKVYALGMETSDQYAFPKSDVLSDEDIENSVAFVLDTANQERVDDQRFSKAKRVIKIDHHPNREPFGDVQCVEDQAAAVCEILTYLFEQMASCKLSKKTAEYLYTGLLTDTLCFRTNNTTSNTLHAASILAEKGLNLPQINRDLFDKDIESFCFSGWVRSHYCFEDGIAYAIVSLADCEEFHQDPGKARTFIDELGHVKEFEMWAIFTEKEEKNDKGEVLYDGSLRSKEVAINDLAANYNGGGHPCAAGVKNLTYQQVLQLIQDLKKLLA